MMLVRMHFARRVKYQISGGAFPCAPTIVLLIAAFEDEAEAGALMGMFGQANCGSIGAFREAESGSGTVLCGLSEIGSRRKKTFHFACPVIPSEYAIFQNAAPGI